ncbi:MAG: glycosyl hydrolase family 18 protein [Sphingobacteriaceae bacterium]
MENIKYIMLTFFLVFALAGCKKGQEAAVDDNFHPRIIDNAGVFTSPNRIIFQGQSAIYSRLTFSPKPIEKTKISWKVNDVEVSTDTAFTFTPTAGGEYVIKVEATYNGQVSTRISNVLVSPENYTPKPSNFVTMAYLSENAVNADINWANVTHVAFSGARVLPDGGVDFSKGNQNQNIDEIVARGHINGVPILLGVTGRLSGIDGWALYNNNDFGAVISDPAKRIALTKLIADYVIARKLDGVDIMMADISNDDGNVVTTAMKAVTPFLQGLKTTLPAGSLVTVTATVNWVNDRYDDLSQASWINVHGFETGYNVGPDAPVGQQSPLWYMEEGANLWISKGIPKNKIVLGIPAFGLRYLELNAAGNNASWGSYDYLSYKEIVMLDPSAPQKEYTALIAKGVYYTGTPLVTQKANFIKTNGFKGAYVWAGDYDAVGDNSLIKTVFKILK